MRVNLTAFTLVIAALLGATRAAAQRAALDADGAAAVDTTSTDTMAHEAATPGKRHGISSPRFLELRLVTAHHSEVPTRMPVAAYRNMYIVDVRAGWTIKSNDVLSLEYAPSVVPLAISTRNPEAYIRQANVTCDDGKSCKNFSARDVETVPLYTNTYGFGLTPVGFQLRLFRNWPVQLLTYANGGALWFTRPLPDPEATRFNFTAELGSALQFNFLDHYGLVFGYSWHHTSNGGTGRVNPGLNSRALTVGIVARRER